MDEMTQIELLRRHLYGFGGIVPKIPGYTVGGFVVEDVEDYLESLNTIISNLLEEKK